MSNGQSFGGEDSGEAQSIEELLELAFTGLFVEAFEVPEGFPEGIPIQRVDFENWSLAISVDDLWAASPVKVDQIVEIANWAVKHGYQVRPLGCSHNWSPLVVPDDDTGGGAKNVLLVDLWQLAVTQQPTLDKNKLQAKFSTGTTVEEATAWLAKQASGGGAPGYTFQNFTAPGKLTLGGVLAIGAHGAGVPWDRRELDLNGCMSNLVVAFEAIVTNPEADKAAKKTYVRKRFTRGDTDADAFLVHLGRAFLTEVTLTVVPNFYVEAGNLYPSVDEFFASPGSTLTAHAFANLLQSVGRVEAIWFPFTSKPWVLTWKIVDDPGPTPVPGPYNLPWARFDEWVTDVLKGLIELKPSLTIDIGRGGLARAEKHAPEGEVMRGIARNLLHYVERKTVRMGALGYALHVKRENVQGVVNALCVQYSEMLSRYAKKGLFPINGPFELRATTIDRSMDLEDPNWPPPALSASAPAGTEDELDTVLWFDVLTLPDTAGSGEFLMELETWLHNKFYGSKDVAIRPEWSKGWAYTKAGPWTNMTVIQGRIPDYYGQAEFTRVLEILSKYDAGEIFTNPFLELLLPHQP